MLFLFQMEPYETYLKLQMLFTFKKEEIEIITIADQYHYSQTCIRQPLLEASKAAILGTFDQALTRWGCSKKIFAFFHPKWMS